MRYIVTVDPKQRSRIQAIADSLVKKGFAIDRVLQLTGIITGSSKQTPENLKIDGIKSVEKEKTVSKL